MLILYLQMCTPKALEKLVELEMAALLHPTSRLMETNSNDATVAFVSILGKV